MNLYVELFLVWLGLSLLVGLILSILARKEKALRKKELPDLREGNELWGKNACDQTISPGGIVRLDLQKTGALTKTILETRETVRKQSETSSSLSHPIEISDDGPTNPRNPRSENVDDSPTNQTSCEKTVRASGAGKR